MSDRLMTTLGPAPSKPRENDLQTEASAVEQLRRKIAEMPMRGEVASPQLLAEFARAQKAYLDKKIEFEKRRRASEGEPAIAAAEVKKGAGQGPSRESKAEAVPVSEPTQPVQESTPSTPFSSIWRMAGIVILLAVLAGLAAAAWLFR